VGFQIHIWFYKTSNSILNMNKIVCLLILVLNALYYPSGAQNPEKLRRSDCFFGVHFDLHASENITDAGKTLTEAMVDTFLAKVRPDFIQIDCKGHPGISSYPTKVGYHVKGFQKDPLKLWRVVTERNKVGLYMHFSGVWDGKVVQEHPDWAVVKPNGERSTQKVSFFSPYLDTYMIPQLKELSGDYHVDGAWIDGECWAVEPDYGEKALKAWKLYSGIDQIPRKKEDPYFPKYQEFTRMLFREHLRKYLDAIHVYNPDFQITSNWSYSSMMPEPVTTNVDFLSGDVTPQNGVFRAAFEARCLAPQGKPWDLMAWGFSWNGSQMPMSNKSTIQLKQEAAEVIAMGGGIQFYYQQNRDLSLKPGLAPTLQELGVFCRERQAFCHKARPIPQIALLYPSASYQKNASVPFSGSTDKLQGTLYSLLDNQYPVEILMEHHLLGKTGNYPLIIIPECDTISAPLLDELKKFVREGGNLLTIGTQTAMIFAKESGIINSEWKKEEPTFISAAAHLGGIRSPLLLVKLDPKAKVISNFYNGNDFRDKSTDIASSINTYGAGKIATVYFNAGSAYAQYKTPVIRDFLAETIHFLLQEMMLKVQGSHLVHVALNKLNGKTYVHLINVAGEHTNQAAIAYDQVPPLENILVSVRTTVKPSKILLQPEGKELDFTFMDGISSLVIPGIEIHAILEIIE
jgi:hypothetical protein